MICPRFSLYSANESSQNNINNTDRQPMGAAEGPMGAGKCRAIAAAFPAPFFIREHHPKERKMSHVRPSEAVHSSKPGNMPGPELTLHISCQQYSMPCHLAHPPRRKMALGEHRHSDALTVLSLRSAGAFEPIYPAGIACLLIHGGETHVPEHCNTRRPCHDLPAHPTTPVSHSGGNRYRPENHSSGLYDFAPAALQCRPVTATYEHGPVTLSGSIQADRHLDERMCDDPCQRLEVSIPSGTSVNASFSVQNHRKEVNPCRSRLG